ncbi:MAG: right-handed parallel beta-helix repeat-containing protein [Phycisphaerae bacterium]
MKARTGHRMAMAVALAGLLLWPATATANSVQSSTMHFEGTLTDAGGGVYTGTIAMTRGAWYCETCPGGDLYVGGSAPYVPGPNQGGFDLLARAGGIAYYDDAVQGVIGTDHDAYSSGGGWGSFYQPDCCDYEHYELTLTGDHWYLRYNGGVLGAGNATPMSGAMDWANLYASEDDIGAYVTPPADPDANDGDAAANGGGPGAWDMDWGWGSEVIPLQASGFIVKVEDLGSGQYHVTLTPDLIEVSQPVQMTSDTHYERGNSVLKDSNGQYWLFWGRHTSFTGNYGSGNPDDSSYDIYYSTASTVAGLAGAGTAVTSGVSIYQGQTTCVEYDGQIWVFAADSGASNQVKAWTMPTSGGSWTASDVLPGGSGPFTGTHMWATVFDGKIFLAVGRGAVIDVTTYDGSNWSAFHQAVNHNGMPRLYVDDTDLYLYYTSWAAPDAYEIYKYNGGTTWNLLATIAGTTDDDCDPMLVKVDDTYAFIFAPWNSGASKQCLKYWVAGSIADFDGQGQADAHYLTAGGYGGTNWVDMWPAALVDGDDVYLFYGSEASGTARGTGNIFMLPFDWGMGADHFNYIQNAVDHATGTTINIAPGTYEEQVVVDGDNIHLVGAGSGPDPATNTVVLSPATLPWLFNTNNRPIVGFTGCTGGSIENLRVDGDGRGNANYRFEGVAFWNAGGDVVDCVITDVRNEPLDGNQHGIGVYAYNDDFGPYTVNVLGTDVDGYQKNGMALSGDGLTANVIGCTVTGGGTMGSGLPAQNGIQISYGAGGSIEDCTIANNIYTENWAASGILLYLGTTVAMSGNTVNGNCPGVYCEDTNGSFADGVISNQHAESWDALYAINTGAALGVGDESKVVAIAAPFEEEVGRADKGRTARTFTLSNSTIVGHGREDSWGVYFKAEGDTLTASMTNCRVENWDLGVYTREAGGTVSLTAHYNDIENNGTYGGFYSNAAGVQDVKNNWWGDASGPYDPDGTEEAGNPPCYDPATMSNADGAGDAVTDLNADYCPWLLGPQNSLVLEAADCQDDTDDVLGGHQIEVELWMRSVVTPVTGFTAFIEFDETALAFVSGTYETQPFLSHQPTSIGLVDTYTDLLEAGGYMQSGDPEWPGATGDWKLATLVFTVLNECATTRVDLTSMIVFNSELSFEGEAVPTSLVNTPEISLDDTDPDITCPTDITIECDASTDPANTGSATATDICDTSVDVTYADVDNLSGCGGYTGTITRTWTAEDDCGNTSSCDQIITVVDTTDPVITCPADVTMECSDSRDPYVNGALGVASATDNCDSTPTITYADVDNLSGCGGYTGTITRTWTAEDDCGNTSSCDQTITVVDTTPPDISCPGDITQNADAGTCSLLVDPGTATATDNCDSSPAITWLRSDSKSSLTDPYDVANSPITITWTATDACGLTDVCYQVVTVLPYNYVSSIEVQLQGVDADDWPTGTLTRCIEFTVKNGLDCEPPVHVWVQFFDTVPPTGVAIGLAPMFEVACGSYSGICAKDEQHTLYDTQSLTISGTDYTNAATLYLLAGDTDNDSDVDIHDVTWLMYQWGQGAGPAAFGDCPWDHTRDADFTNDNILDSDDYLLLSNNWHQYRMCSCSSYLGAGGHQVSQAGPRVAMLTSDLPWEMADSVDLNRDGVVDFLDVREFEIQNGLPDTLSSLMEASTQPAAPAASRRHP